MTDNIVYYSDNEKYFSEHDIDDIISDKGNYFSGEDSNDELYIDPKENYEMPQFDGFQRLMKIEFYLYLDYIKPLFENSKETMEIFNNLLSDDIDNYLKFYYNISEDCEPPNSYYRQCQNCENRVIDFEINYYSIFELACKHINIDVMNYIIDKYPDIVDKINIAAMFLTTEQKNFPILIPYIENKFPHYDFEKFKKYIFTTKRCNNFDCDSLKYVLKKFPDIKMDKIFIMNVKDIDVLNFILETYQECDDDIYMHYVKVIVEYINTKKKYVKTECDKK